MARPRPHQGSRAESPRLRRAPNSRFLPTACVWIACVLSSAVGEPARDRVPSGALLASRELRAGDSLHLSFKLPHMTPGTCPVLELDVRLQAASFAGSNTAFAIAVNGQTLAEDRLMNKPLLFAQANGVLAVWCDEARWRAVYSPDFDPRRSTTDEVHRVVGVDPYHLALRIDGLVNHVSNEMTLTHIGARLPPLEVARVRVGTLVCPSALSETNDTGVEPLPVATPVQFPSASAGLAADGAVHFIAGDTAFDIETEVSKPRGDWRLLGREARGWKRLACSVETLRAEASDLVLDRRLSVRDGSTELRDVLVNRTSTNLGVQVRYRILVPTAKCTTYLGGLRLPPEPTRLDRYEPQAPSAVAVVNGAAVGLLPANDALWIQSRTFRDSLGVGLFDAQICIAPADSIELALRIIAVSPGSYWEWLDVARADLGANFTIEGGFAFASYSMAHWPTEKLRDWIAMRHLRYVSAQPPTASGSTGLQGPALLQSPRALNMMRHFVTAVHRAAPEVKVLAYFHCYLINSASMLPKYRGARVLGQSLAPVYYPRPSAPTEFQLCLPQPGSAFAADLEQLLDQIFEFGYDGIYWDEMSYSSTPWTYGGEWDGVSGDVDPQSHLLLRTKGAVPLLAQPWIESRLDDLERRGKVVVANSEPVTLTIRRYRFPRFVETTSTIALASTQLWSPIGLGDRLREHTSADVAARIRGQLARSALYFYYSPTVPLATENLTAYMYPMTPIRIREGTLLGRERILTARSGRFGWGDSSNTKCTSSMSPGKR